MNPIATRHAPSIVYNLLLRFQWLERGHFTGPIWRKLWNVACHTFHGPVATTLHGYRVTLNFGYTYPWFARRYPRLNQPLVELVQQTFSALQRPVFLVDVGAAVGDTVLLVDSNCPGAIGRFCCVDGDREFFRYLQKNLGARSNGELVLALLSDEEGHERGLVRIHAGTASAQGTDLVPSRTLDSLLLEKDRKVDVLKIDVDGFDGKVLSGARGILMQHVPNVIFEWHPILYRRTGNDYLKPFQVLVDCGYRTFVWFTKFGEFSHFTCGRDPEALEMTAQLCLREKHVDDWHYDVVALHSESVISPLNLAELSYAKRRVSRW